MNLRYVQTFIEIVRKGSFYKAAQSLGFAQATVSQQIQQLERELDVSLFERNGKRIAVSAAGHALYGQAVELVERAQAVETNIKDFGVGDGGVLRIGSVEPAASQRVTPLLKSFCRTRPQLRVIFEVSGAQTLTALCAAVLLDCGLSPNPADSLGVSFERVFDEELRALVPADHPAARKPAISLHEICKQQLMLTEPACCYRQLFEDAARGHGKMPIPLMQVSSNAAAFAAVENGFGIAILPRSMAANSSRVIVKRLAGMRLLLPIGLVVRPGAIVPPVAKQFIEALRAECKRPGALGTGAIAV